MQMREATWRCFRCSAEPNDEAMGIAAATAALYKDDEERRDSDE